MRTHKNSGANHLELNFSYKSYIELVQLLLKYQYKITNYDEFNQYEKCVILRHDIDISLEKAAIMAKLEYDHGIKSTYFVMVTGEFYNVLHFKEQKLIKDIQRYGHDIGLHFDELNYPEILDSKDMIKYIQEERQLLSLITRQEISKISMHRPSQKTLQADLHIPGMCNTYSHLFFTDFKYLSDSRHTWREPVEEIISNETFKRIQILIHPDSYSEQPAMIKDWAESLLEEANMEAYEKLKRNITNFDSILV